MAAPLPNSHHAIGSTWAYRFKYDEVNNPIYAKNRVCPQGFSQIPHVDYDPEKFASPTVQLVSVHLIRHRYQSYSPHQRTSRNSSVFLQLE
jgi:hypothetical protein